MKHFLDTAHKAALLWYDKDADHMAATMSYYVLFAITPLLLLTVAISSLLYGKDFVAATLYAWGSILGPDILTLLHDAVRNLEILSSGFGVPLFGAIFFSGMVIVMFNTFITGLHHLWGIPHRGFMGWLKKSMHSIIFVVALEAYLLFLVGLDRIVSVLADATGVAGALIIHPIFFVIATAVLFSLAYRVLPWEAPSIKARLYGGLVASVLFIVVKWLIAWYVGRTPVPDLFGTAGLVLALLIWIYVTACILYYGAAFAHVLENGDNE